MTVAPLTSPPREQRPGLAEKLARARVAVRDERVQLRETLRQRGPVARLPFEDEELQARGQVRGRADDDLGEARAAGGLVGRRRGRVRLHASREAPARLEVARVEGRGLLESGAGGGGPVSLVLEDRPNRLEGPPGPRVRAPCRGGPPRPARSFSRSAAIAPFASGSASPGNASASFANVERASFGRSSSSCASPTLRSVRMRDACSGENRGEEGFSAEEKDGRKTAAATNARSAPQPLRSKRDPS